jgi:acetolactate synthase-1/2/3 large subunit
VSKESGARYIAETLKGYGVTHVFYMEIILPTSLIEMERLGIKRIVTHGEKAAAYMADGYARLGRRPGICMAQSVGAANLAAGLQDAYLAHSPVIAVAGSKPLLYQQRNAYQEILHQPLYDGLTKYNVKVDTVEQLPFVLPQAFREATTVTPGPVHIDVPGLFGEFLERAEADTPVVVEPAYGQYPVWRPVPGDQDLRQAAQALLAAKRPVIVVGRGAFISGAAQEVVQLAEQLSIPVAASPDGKAVMADDHPLFVGPVGGYGRPCANHVVSRADLVFFVGCGTGDQVTSNWSLPPTGTRVVQLDIDPAEIGRNYPGALGLVGDAKKTLQALLDRVDAHPEANDWAQYAQAVVQKWRQAVAPLQNSDATPVRPERLCKEITDILPEDAVVVADTGYSAIWSGTMIDFLHPDQVYLRSAGSLGWSLPAAMGAKCAAPERPVFCFCGDGALWYHLSELETASRWGIQVITIVNNNSMLGQIAPFSQRAGKDHPGHNLEAAYRYRETNFARIAEEMGCFGIRVERPQDIRGAIQQALDQDRPAVVDVVTDGGAHPLTDVDLEVAIGWNG